MDRFKDIWSDIKASPYILNICRQPRTFVKLHAGVSAIVGLVFIMMILIIGISNYFSEDLDKKKSGGMIIFSAYILFVILIFFWTIPVVVLGLKYNLINL